MKSASSSKRTILALFGLIGLVCYFLQVIVKTCPTATISLMIGGEETTTTATELLNDEQSTTTTTTTTKTIQSSHQQKKKNFDTYTPAPIEKYIMDHLLEWGWDKKPDPPGCFIWNEPNSTEFHSQLQSYIHELEEYHHLIESFPAKTEDIRKTKSGNKNVCSTLKLHPDGLPAIFRKSGSQLLSHSSHSGYMEPLITPMRHPRFCTDGWKYLVNMKYMIHDFEAMCHHKILHSHRTILIDIGASLSFHDGRYNENNVTPIFYLLELYKKFGIYFDHIYGYEADFTEPTKVYEELLPHEYMTSYHWMNIGVTSDEHNNHTNPWNSILRQLTPDDFIVIKLDIDTSWIEVPLANQLLNDPNLLPLVDQFYFEHHVHMKEMVSTWKSTMNGTLYDTFTLFYQFRKMGDISAHFWV